MKWTSILAIYFLFWVLSAFLVMPIGLRTSDETGDRVEPGHAPSAPVNFRPALIAKRATILAIVLFGLYYANYVHRWIEPDDLNLIGSPPSSRLPPDRPAGAQTEWNQSSVIRLKVQVANSPGEVSDRNGSNRA